MFKTLKVKLLPNDKQKGVLINTFARFNETCNYVSEIVFEKKLYSKVLLQQIVYNLNSTQS